MFDIFQNVAVNDDRFNNKKSMAAFVVAQVGVPNNMVSVAVQIEQNLRSRKYPIARNALHKMFVLMGTADEDIDLDMDTDTPVDCAKMYWREKANILIAQNPNIALETGIMCTKAIEKHYMHSAEMQFLAYALIVSACGRKIERGDDYETGLMLQGLELVMKRCSSPLGCDVIEDMFHDASTVFISTLRATKPTQRYNVMSDFDKRLKEYENYPPLMKAFLEKLSVIARIEHDGEHSAIFFQDESVHDLSAMPHIRHLRLVRG